MSSGLGIVPSQRPVDSVAVKGLYNEAVAQERQWQLATTCAPITQMGAHEGTYPTDATWRGVDLSTDANIASEVALSATNYAPLAIDFSSNSYRCARYQLGQIDIPDREAAKLLLDNGVDVESYSSRILAGRSAALHYYHTFTALGTSGNYTNAADPGNITSASFALVGLLDTVEDALLDEEAWDIGAPLDIWIARDVKKHLKLNTEIRNRVGTANDTIPTDDDVLQFFRDYLPGVKNVNYVTGKYKAANGTKTDIFSGKIAFTVPGSGLEKSFLKTIVPSDNSGGPLDMRSERVEAMPGLRMYADAYYDVHVADAGAGYLAYDLLS
jgi:hypothetical protein